MARTKFIYTETVMAEQFIGDTSMEGICTAPNKYADGCPHVHHPVGGREIGITIVEKGDWLVEDLEGVDRSVFSNREFQERFKRAD